MHTTIRIYTCDPALAALAAAKKDTIEKAFRGVPGFAGYRLICTPTGVASVTICENQGGCDESARVAAAWLKENLPDAVVAAPTVITGESHISFGAKPK